MRIIMALLSLILLSAPTGAYCETTAALRNVQINEAKIEINGNTVRYPQLTGMADEAVQQKINDDIVLSGDVTAHILTLSTLVKGSAGLDVSYESYVNEQVFSTVLIAVGKLPGGSNGQSNVALTYDLRTGERLTLDALLSDVSSAAAHMEALAEETLAAELSDYIENTAVSPLPVDSFMLDEDGVTFYYPSKQLSYLSGYGGACQFYYEEISQYLLDAADGLPALMGILPQDYTPAEQQALIETAATAGALPHVPVKLGDGMTQLVEKYRLVRTPDAFPGGRYFVLEAPAFRSVLLISDSMEAGYSHSELQGIQMRRGSLYGLMIGQASRQAWQEALGQPDETIIFTENMAYDYSLPVGECDVYRFGDYQLRLHGDTDGVLRCVQLSK